MRCCVLRAFWLAKLTGRFRKSRWNAFKEEGEHDASLQELFMGALAADQLWQPVARSAILPAAEGADPDVLEQVSRVQDASLPHLQGVAAT